MKKYASRHGFTLIELLTVVVVIGILAGMILAGSLSLKKQGRKRKAAIEAAALKTAIKAYRVEYGRWPVPSHYYADDATNSSIIWFRADESENEPGGINYCGSNGEVFRFLDPENDAEEYNPRQILFVEKETFSLAERMSGFSDVLTPWGAMNWFYDDDEYKNYYKITIDLNYPASGSDVSVSYEIGR